MAIGANADLRCERCDKTGSLVIDSRAPKTRNYIRRRRECIHCHYRYTTRELPVSAAIVPVEVDDRLSHIQASIVRLRDDLKSTTSSAVEDEPIADVAPRK